MGLLFLLSVAYAVLLVHNHPTSLGKRERQGDYLPPRQGPPCTLAGEVPCYLSPGQGSPFSYHLRCFCTGTCEETEQTDLLLLSHQRDLQIGRPVFRLVKSTTVNVFAPIKKHAVVDVNEVIVHIGLALDQTKQRKGF